MSATSAVIHVVDDDASFRNALSRLLQTVGYQVTQYKSGDELLTAFGYDAANRRSSRLGCILLDLRMSGLDGLALQERLSKLENILPIVFLTGHGDIPASVRAIKAGAEDFLSKPVEKKKLLEA